MINQGDLPGTLQKIGLSEKEAQVYASLLVLGGAYPSKIAEHTKLNRTTVYKILLNLSVKGLVNEIEKKNKAYYQIEKPDRLLRYAKSQVSIAHDRVDVTEKLLPDFEGLYSLITNKPRILYFENMDGLMSIYEDQVNTTKKYEMLAFSNIAEFEKLFPEKFFENFRRSKEKIGITTRGITPDTSEDQTFANRAYDGYKKEVIPQIRRIPAAEFPFKGEIVVYGENKVSIVNFNKEHLTGLIIEDQTIHDMMKMIFELSWNSKLVNGD